jgi:hypothetical protein
MSLTFIRHSSFFFTSGSLCACPYFFPFNYSLFAIWLSVFMTFTFILYTYVWLPVFTSFTFILSLIYSSFIHFEHENMESNNLSLGLSRELERPMKNIIPAWKFPENKEIMYFSHFFYTIKNELSMTSVSLSLIMYLSI